MGFGWLGKEGMKKRLSKVAGGVLYLGGGFGAFMTGRVSSSS